MMTETSTFLEDKLISIALKGYSRVMQLSGGSETFENSYKILKQQKVFTGNELKYSITERWESYHGNMLFVDAVGEGRRNYAWGLRLVTK
jgi:adenosylmethionine-8-amino-7-oxononanoate aminotransferase